MRANLRLSRYADACGLLDSPILAALGWGTRLPTYVFCGMPLPGCWNRSPHLRYDWALGAKEPLGMSMALIQPKQISGELRREVERAAKNHTFIVRTIPDKFIGNSDEKILIASMLSLVLEHHGAIIHLFGTGQFDGSALALVRPLIDSAYRAHWVYSCASKDNLVKIREGQDVYPGLINMATEIEKKVGAGGFFLGVEPYIKALHGYTHGGLEQLGRRFDADGDVRPSYRDGEKSEAIRATTAHLTALTIAWCQIVSDNTSGDDPNAKSISDYYSSLYGQPDSSNLGSR